MMRAADQRMQNTVFLEKQVSSSGYAYGDKPALEEIKSWEEEFKGYANDGSLELYTCMSLSYGIAGVEDASTRKILLGVLFCCIFQLGIPYMMMTFRMDELAAQETTTDLRFRLVGFLVYMYSIK